MPLVRHETHVLKQRPNDPDDAIDIKATPANADVPVPHVELVITKGASRMTLVFAPGEATSIGVALIQVDAVAQHRPPPAPGELLKPAVLA